MHTAHVSIRPTLASEAEMLAEIQKAAFLPLYARYHDVSNPCHRGAEDILRRLNAENRYYTIFYDGQCAGGIFYRLHGTRPPGLALRDGEYYLVRVYIRPELQGRGIAREAILLCEREFPNARTYYVDFPEDLEINRRCYEHAGYCDTGERLRIDGAPVLALFRKII